MYLLIVINLLFKYILSYLFLGHVKILGLDDIFPRWCLYVYFQNECYFLY